MSKGEILRSLKSALQTALSHPDITDEEVSNLSKSTIKIFTTTKNTPTFLTQRGISVSIKELERKEYDSPQYQLTFFRNGSDIYECPVYHEYEEWTKHGVLMCKTVLNVGALVISYCSDDFETYDSDFEFSEFVARLRFSEILGKEKKEFEDLLGWLIRSFVPSGEGQIEEFIETVLNEEWSDNE